MRYRRGEYTFITGEESSSHAETKRGFIDCLKKLQLWFSQDIYRIEGITGLGIHNQITKIRANIANQLLNEPGLKDIIDEATNTIINETSEINKEVSNLNLISFLSVPQIQKIIVRNDKNEIIGLLFLEKSKCDYESRPTFMYRCAYVAPAARGHGIYANMRDILRTQILSKYPNAVLLSTTKNPTVKRKSLNDGWQEIGLPTAIGIHNNSLEYLTEIEEALKSSIEAGYTGFILE